MYRGTTVAAHAVRVPVRRALPRSDRMRAGSDLHLRRSGELEVHYEPIVTLRTAA